MSHGLNPQVKPFEIKTVLILRPDNEGGTHAGQIAFPGGRIDDADKDLAETALRETEEEIGVNRNSVSILGALTPLYIPVSNYMVHPYIGAVSSMPQFNLNPLEVKGLIEVSINDLVSEGNKKSVEKYLKVKGSAMQVPCYDINGQIIWGATAMIISEFVEIIRRIK
jgi:hypothetical protein